MATERLRTRRKALVGLPPAIVEQLAEARTVLDNLEDQFAAMAATQVPAAPDAKRDLDRQRAADVRAEVSRIADPCRMLPRGRLLSC